MAQLDKFSVDEVKNFVLYGWSADKDIDLKVGDTGDIKYALDQMFQMMKKTHRFDVDRLEKVLWDRITALVNLNFR